MHARVIKHTHAAGHSCSTYCYYYKLYCININFLPRESRCAWTAILLKKKCTNTLLRKNDGLIVRLAESRTLGRIYGGCQHHYYWSAEKATLLVLYLSNSIGTRAVPIKYR